MNESVEPTVGENENLSKGRKRQRSTIAFPYTDYESCYALAVAVHGNVGHGECTVGQLAAWANQSFKSSTFRSQLAAAKLFGIIESGAETGNLKLTGLGRQTFDPNKAQSAKAQAFLCVPLFHALYEKYKDGITPPDTALEREIESLGVAKKQKAKARQVFKSSAQQTGFRDAAPNKLVLPATKVKSEDKQGKHDYGRDKSGGKGSNTEGSGDLGLDPLIMALLRKIPQNDNWPAESRLRWFKTFAMNVSQVYDNDVSIVELNIELSPQDTREISGSTEN